jgi:CheY-like chemotaxis protein
MSHESRRASVILVADDVEETRDAVDRLLTADGYRVDPARGESDAVERAGRQRPDLILVSLGGPSGDRIAVAQRIRWKAGLGEVPVVVFCVPTVDEGAEVAIGGNVHVTRPENFDQLRGLIRRLLDGRRPG